MFARKVLLAVIFSSLLGKVNAQFALPRIDIEAKISQCVMPGDDKEGTTLKAMETTNFVLGAHWQITQNVAVGWIYSNSLRGNGYNNKDFKFNFGGGDTKALSSYSCFDVRLSAGRAPRWRPYANLNYSKVEIVEDRGSFRLASNSNAFGGGIGIMRRYGNHLYWNVFEVNFKKLSDKLFWADVGFMLEIKTGFTYNIGKRK